MSDVIGIGNITKYVDGAKQVNCIQYVIRKDGEAPPKKRKRGLDDEGTEEPPDEDKELENIKHNLRESAESARTIYEK